MRSDGLVRALDGNTFVVSDRRGDIEPDLLEPTGLFAFDTRHLSTWVLTLDGDRLTTLSVDDLQYFQSRFFLAPGRATTYIDARLSVIRERLVGRGFAEEITILNYDDRPVHLEMRLAAHADFADIFEIRDKLAKSGEYYRRASTDRLVIGYRRETFVRETWISSTEPAAIDETGIGFSIDVPGGGRWCTEVDVTAAMGVPGEAWTQPKHHHHQREPRPEIQTSFQAWMDNAPKLSCDWDPLKHTYRRSLTDLAALRFRPVTLPHQSLPAAGLPWFMAMFGRDSLLTSFQALPFESELAATTLVALGLWQGSHEDDFRDEDPGRILHEMRFGEMTAFEERPQSPYYGSVDATPLYVVLLDEYERWTGDRNLVAKLEPQARLALKWIDRYGDLVGNGYLSYRRRNEQSGLENQCWKDSWDAISFRDGRLPDFPRATAELQGYVYDAKLRAARLSRLVWNDEGFARRLEHEAALLKERFNRDFWIADGEYFALGLDGNGDRIDSLASNMGHLLWSGIVDTSRAGAVVQHLMSPALFSGWGIRTLGTGEHRYNPLGYHVGTVWPFDNAFIALGLRRYGYKAEAARIAAGILDAARYFEGRLPEAFAGYPRELTMFPVEYPTACSPQAWSTGTPLLLLRTMLGLEPVGDHLIVDAALPAGIGRLELLDIPGRWGHVDAFGRGRVQTSDARVMDRELGISASNGLSTTRSRADGERRPSTSRAREGE